MLVVTTKPSPTTARAHPCPAQPHIRGSWGWVRLGQAQTLPTTPNLLISAAIIPTWVSSSCRREGGKDIHTHMCHKLN